MHLPASIIVVPGAVQPHIAQQEGIDCGGEPGVKTATIPQNSAITVLAKGIVLPDGSPLVRGSVTAMSANVTDITNPRSPGDTVTASIDPDAALKSSHSGTTGPWTLCIPLAATLFPDPERVYRLEVQITPTAGHGGMFYLTPWNFETTRMYSHQS